MPLRKIPLNTNPSKTFIKREFDSVEYVYDGVAMIPFSGFPVAANDGKSLLYSYESFPRYSITKIPIYSGSDKNKIGNVVIPVVNAMLDYGNDYIEVIDAYYKSGPDGIFTVIDYYDGSDNYGVVYCNGKLWIGHEDLYMADGFALIGDNLYAFNLYDYSYKIYTPVEYDIKKLTYSYDATPPLSSYTEIFYPGETTLIDVVGNYWSASNLEFIYVNFYYNNDAVIFVYSAIDYSNEMIYFGAVNVFDHNHIHAVGYSDYIGETKLLHVLYSMNDVVVAIAGETANYELRYSKNDNSFTATAIYSNGYPINFTGIFPGVYVNRYNAFVSEYVDYYADILRDNTLYEINVVV